MKIISKQRNSKMCVICGLDNTFGVRAPFYNMADGSVMTVFRYQAHHQSYPGRVHGGLITAMLDEMGLRGLWANHLDETQFGVTIQLDTNYRKPVPYETDLIGRGIVTHESPRFFIIDSSIFDPAGTLLANGTVKYIKMDVGKISEGSSIHDEMPYLIEDGRTEISL